MRLMLAAIGATVITGCSTLSTPVPPNYTGPLVQLADTGYLESSHRGAFLNAVTGHQESSGRGVFFAAVEINGQAINNAYRETRLASQGRGFGLRPVYTRRDVPVLPMQVALSGGHESAAPIEAILFAAAGDHLSVNGVVTFNPSEGRSYFVTGELKKERSCIWIADTTSKQPVTEKICNK